MNADRLKAFRKELNRLVTLNRASLALADSRRGGGGKTWTNTARRRDEQFDRVRGLAADLFNLRDEEPTNPT